MKLVIDNDETSIDMVRHKITKAVILLKSELQRGTLLSLINNLPLDNEKPIQVTINELKVKRNLGQNALYHKRIGEIANKGWFNGRQYSSDVWHEYAKKYLIEDCLDDDRGPRDLMPDGSVVSLSTTKLSKSEMAKLILSVEAFGASLGVLFSANPNEF